MSTNDPVLKLVRPEILALTPYSSARSEAKGLAANAATIWLDANENPETPSAGQPLLNRYPEPQPGELTGKLARLYSVPARQLLVTRGSDEGIDLLLRAFCRAGRDAILTTPPTYGMYSVAAGIQDAQVITVPLIREKDFAVDADAVIAATGPMVKLVFLCSPNNPTGQLMDAGAVRKIASALLGRAVVVVDEAYLEFSGTNGFASEVDRIPNLIVLRTLSKAHGLAGARVGVTITSAAVIDVLRKIIAPYPIPAPVVQAALAALTPAALAAATESVRTLVAERKRLAIALRALPAVRHIWPSDANFLLVEVTDATRAMDAGRAACVIWRDRQRDVAGTIRITVGTVDENNRTLEVMGRV
ncbi:MAG TPA: histidinol-phosphate transaminase [Candidatus Didemnitutus sp.]|nr:histidinol-phosphate transaminase [Candidatus Didemnitutus sp.]